MEYQAIYKCRLCGREYVRAVASDLDIVVKNMLRMCDGIEITQNIGNPVTLTEMHSCKDGSCGLADFQGFKAVEE